MAGPGRGTILFPSNHRLKATQTDGDRWGWTVLAPYPDQTVLMVGTRNYGTPYDALRQAKIAFKRHRVDLLLLTKGRPAGTASFDVTDVSSRLNR